MIERAGNNQLKNRRSTKEELTWLQGRTQTTLVQTRPGGVGREWTHHESGIRSCP